MVATLSLCMVEAKEVEMNLYETLLRLFHIQTVLLQVLEVATVSCLHLGQTFYKEQEEEHPQIH